MNINKVLIETNQTRPHMTIFFLICWEKTKRFSLIVNSVKILSEKDKKIQRKYKFVEKWINVSNNDKVYKALTAHNEIVGNDTSLLKNKWQKSE